MALTSRLALAWALFATAASAVAQRTPDEAQRALLEGNRRFVAERSLPQPLGEGVRRTLARGESPFAVVLCCADSQVAPEHVFNTGLGELFVVRIAGHACSAEALASIEYAVEHLNASLCVVLGHEGCGAIDAAVAQAPSDGTSVPARSQAMQLLLERIEPAVRRARAQDLGGKQLRDQVEVEHVHQTVHESLRRSDLLRRYASVGRFRMVPARYHQDSGEVEWLPVRPMPTTNPDAETAAATHGSVPAGVPPHVALRLLQAGHRRFLGDGKPTGDVGRQRREALTHGQQPLAIVLTCADSRVAPEHLFDSGLGELFVVRIAGNMLNDDALASIEYAAASTGASLLVVMGHTRCSAVQAALDHPENSQLSPNLRTLLARIEPAVAAARAQGRSDLVDLAVRANVLRSVAEARSRSALLRQLEAEGRFALLPAVYDLATGDLEWLKDQGPTEPPAAAPAGETHATPTRGHTAGHGAAGHGAAGHGAAVPTSDHGDLPVLPWATGGDAHSDHGAQGTDPAAGHGTDHGHDAGHGTPAPHGNHAAPTGHGDHGADHEHAAAAPAGPEPWWRDLRHVIGLAGIVSMSLAAVLVMKKRS